MSSRTSSRSTLTMVPSTMSPSLKYLMVASIAARKSSSEPMSLTATCGASERVGVTVIRGWVPREWDGVVRTRGKSGFTTIGCRVPPAPEDEPRGRATDSERESAMSETQADSCASLRIRKQLRLSPTVGRLWRSRFGVQVPAEGHRPQQRGSPLGDRVPRRPAGEVHQREEVGRPREVQAVLPGVDDAVAVAAEDRGREGLVPVEPQQVAEVRVRPAGGGVPPVQ